MPPGLAETPVEKGADVRAGDLVAGHYRVERVIGSGGMGVVVAARDERTGEAVAVKLLRSIDDTRAVERFFREARAMGKLDSEHVVRVRDAGSDGRKPYLVMDRLEGVDLAARTKQVGPLSVREAADHVVEACEALSHAHSKGIVHRDVKPSNLFLHTVNGKTILKVLDFGISKVQTRDVWERTLTTTDDGGVLGSPPYMSPEQVRDPKAVDSRTDVWSLGVVLYKILSGAVPYDGESVGEVFAKVLERPYPSLRVTTDVPDELDAIVRRCLAKDRNERWSHVGELALALAPFASPDRAALAPRIAQRMHDEGPTLERPSSIPDVAPRDRGRDRGDPATMSLSGPPPEALAASASTSAPPPAYPSLPPPPSFAPSFAPARASAPAPALTTASVSLDVDPPAPNRARRVGLVLGIIGVAAGIGIGLALRAGSSAATQANDDRSAATSAAPAPASATATAASTSATSPTVPSATIAAATPSTVTAAPSASVFKLPRPRGVGPRRPGAGATAGAGNGITGSATPATTTTTTTTTTTRPELQPSPYPTAP
jgi:serine/threonine protein kinase